VHNTHAKTHQGYKLVVEQIFKVRRQGEEERFEPVRSLLETENARHVFRLNAGALCSRLPDSPPVLRGRVDSPSNFFCPISMRMGRMRR
jgi:hypothetical protein